MKSKKFLLPMKLQFFAEDPEGGTLPEGDKVQHRLIQKNQKVEKPFLAMKYPKC